MKRIILFGFAVAFCGCSAPKATVEFRLGETNPGPGLTEMTVPGSKQPVFLSATPVMTNADIASASVVTNSNKPAVGFTLTEAGAKKFADITSKNLNKPLGMVVDGKLISAPIIRAEIAGGSGVITGDFSVEEAKRIASAFPKR